VRRRTSAAAVLAVACLVLTACGVSMPDSGPVHETAATGADRDDQPARIDPPRPRKGASPEEIVDGFLEAMQETPAVTTSVARQFLTKAAAASWQPRGMEIYGGVIGPRGNNTKVDVKLVGANRTDARGAWVGPVSEDDSTITFEMAYVDDGEYRIAKPPDDLLVPAEWFAARFTQVSLYFFDPTAQILVPEPVFVPRGPQFASALVTALLQGPSLSSERSYVPSGLRPVGLSVRVSKAGVARVDLTSDAGDVPMPTQPSSELLVSQLAWTLQQDPTIARFAVTIDGRPLQLPNETEFSVDHGHQYAPYLSGSSTQLFGLRDGLMVGGSPQNLADVSGPFGRKDYHLRTVSPDLKADQVAGVTEDGTTLWMGSVKDNGRDPTQLLTTGEDLLRPAWDFLGRVWEIDRRSTGAVVSYSYKGEMVPLDVPGISDEDVKHFLVSRDGTRLIAVVRQGAGEDSIVVSRIVSTGDGLVAAAQAVDSITDPGEGQVRDIAWRSPTSIAVLRPVDRELLQVRDASVDGANPSDQSVPVDGRVVSLAGIPVPGETTYAFEPAGPDDPSATLVDLAGPRANQTEIDPPASFLAYAG
jgi:hypothetical protein